MKLIDTKTGKQIHKNDIVTTFRGEPYVLADFYSKPPPSTGRVVLKDTIDGPTVGEYYPGVINAVIVDD